MFSHVVELAESWADVALGLAWLSGRTAGHVMAVATRRLQAARALTCLTQGFKVPQVQSMRWVQSDHG